METSDRVGVASDPLPLFLQHASMVQGQRQGYGVARGLSQIHRQTGQGATSRSSIREKQEQRHCRRGAQRSQSDSRTRPRDFRALHGGPSGWGQGHRNQAESEASAAVGKTGTSPARGSPRNLGAESAMGPHVLSDSPLLVGHRIITGGA